MIFDVLIVGGGHGGAQAAIALRQHKFAGSIGIVGEESELPYERPPLSKDYLSGTKSFERILIRPPQFWQDRDVTMLVGHRVAAVDQDGRTVTTADGDVIGYRQLIWAAGGHARRLSCSGHDRPGIHTVRTRADVDRLLDELAASTRVVVIGGGYIGLEAAAVLTKMGKQVTVVEALDRVLARVAGAPLSRFFEAEHRAHGVDLRLDTSVTGIDAGDGAGHVVRLDDGTSLDADMVIVGIGIVPAVQPLLDAGAAGGNGVEIDLFGRTSLPGIFAIGDCALHPNPHAHGQLVRLESVQNANDLATTVAGVICGDEQPYQAIPWFWSNQYDITLQTVGLSMQHDFIVIRGDIASRSFAVVYLRDGAVIALDCVNSTRDYVQGKRLVASQAKVAPARLSDPTIPLKEMIS